MLDKDVITGIIDLVKKPTILTFLLLLIGMTYAFPLFMVLKSNTENTDRLVHAIDTQGTRWESLVTTLISKR